MVAEPAFRRTLQRLPVKGQQNIAILNARLLSCAPEFQGADRWRGVPFPPDRKTKRGVALARVLQQPARASQQVVKWNFIGPGNVARKKIF